MDQILHLAFGIGLSYAVGTCVAGFYVTRWRIDKDLRELGSGSAGARNAARILGRGFGVAVFAWDFAKGALAVVLVRYLFADELVTGASAAAVVLGHVWPAQLGFRGGMGVAPAAGALVVLQPAVLAIVAVVYALGAVVSRDVARRALAAFAAGVAGIPFLGMPTGEAVACAVMLAILIWTHRGGLLFRKNDVVKQEMK
jgi:glycerol-3-phosphate acyltransferase PlsY